MKEWFVSELPVAMGRTVHDVQMITDYVQSRTDVDSSKIGIFGQGSGGTAALLAASVDKRLRAVDVLNPWGDWKNWMKSASEIRTLEDRKQFTSKEYLKSIAPFDPLNKQKSIRAPFLRMQFIRKQQNVVDSAANALLKALTKNATTKSYEDAASSVNDLSDGKIFDWIAKSLKALK